MLSRQQCWPQICNHWNMNNWNLAFMNCKQIQCSNWAECSKYNLFLPQQRFCVNCYLVFTASTHPIPIPLFCCISPWAGMWAAHWLTDHVALQQRRRQSQTDGQSGTAKVAEREAKKLRHDAQGEDRTAVVESAPIWYQAEITVYFAT